MIVTQSNGLTGDTVKDREWRQRSAERAAAKRRAAVEITRNGQRTTVRRKPVKARSKKRAEQMREYVPLMLAFLTANPLCMRCGKPATCVHHSGGRRGWLLLAVEFWKASCNDCNEFAETDTGAALAEGWLIPSPRKPVAA